MAHLEQGQNLQEQPIVDANGNIVSAGDPNSGNQREPPKFGPKQIAIVAAAVVVLGVGIYIFANRGKSDEVTSEPSTTEATSETYEMPPLPAGFIDPNNPNSSTAPISQGTPIDPYANISYTQSDVEELRGLGYTGDEIEAFAQEGRSMDSLRADAYALMDKQYEKWRESVLDDASDGYKELVEKTYIGNKTTKSNVAQGEVTISYKLTENVDYEKIGVYNYQTWVKVHLFYGDVFMHVPIERYTELPESGNIVVSFTARCNEADVVLEITDLQEVVV